MKKNIEKNCQKKSAAGRPRTLKEWTSPLLRDRANEYFAKCDARKKSVVAGDTVVEVGNPAPYTIHGLCNYLEITRMTFGNWCRLENALGERAKMLHQKITENRISGALDGAQNPAFARFMLVNDNKDEYREKVEIQGGVTPELKTVLDLIKDSTPKVPGQ